MGVWQEALAEAAPRPGRVLMPWRPSVDDVLEVRAGERVRLGIRAETWPGWRFCTAQNGQEGWIHEVYLDTLGADEALLREPYSSRELSLDEGDRVTVYRAVGGWLWVQVPQGAWGWVPEEQVTPEA